MMRPGIRSAPACTGSEPSATLAPMPRWGDRPGRVGETVCMARNGSQARSVVDLARQVQAGARPTYLFFWDHEPRADGNLGPSCLSQWWPARFSSDGEVFGSAEQYMMWRKAILFGDSERAAAILHTRSPLQAKALGRMVEHFDDATWVEHRWQIVVAASVAKFSSDPHLRSFLTATGRRVLVEASPVDKIWGIGLAADSEFAALPQRWRGLNLLGFALMEARDQLDISK
jgi:ribA/ribD-fused uncharacterized protein